MRMDRSIGARARIPRRPLCALVLASLLLWAAPALPAERSVIIGFEQRPGPPEHALIRAARGSVERTYELIPAVAATLPEREIANLRKHDRVRYVEENAVYWAATATSSSQEYDDSWGVRHIEADIAHASGNKGSGVSVALLDTGIDYSHPDLAGNYRGGYDFVFDDADPWDDSFNSHGTHVAGIVAAREDGFGVVGVAPEVDLFALKVLDGAGFGREDWLIAGIDWAVRNGVDVINLSIRGPDAQGLRDACDRALEAGVLLVAAGGGSVAGGGPVAYPAAYASVIAVTATDLMDRPGYFAPIGEELELAAPGVDVFSTTAGGSYGFLSGTSQAAPHVAGVAALHIVSNTQDLNGDGLLDHEDVRLILQAQASDLGAAGRDDVYGFGLVNGAGASIPSEVAVSVIRTAGMPKRDAEWTDIAGVPYRISVANAGLSRLLVDVFEGETRRSDLSTALVFRPGDPQAVVFGLDATETRFSVSFTPYGRRGASAEVLLEMIPE
jgi:subtilisin